MYYEEKYENGLWYWRGTPDGAWIKMGTRMLSEKLAAAQRGLAAYREPTVEDARMFWELYVRADISPESADADTQELFKQLGFVRKVTPNE